MAFPYGNVWFGALFTRLMAGILSMNDVSKVGKPGLRVLMAMVFASAQIPVECVAIVAGIDRIVDMGRTVMSITGDASCAVVMHKTEEHTHSA